jgi:nitrite reductase/ring-hydroxylating ferredoxin subunit
MSSDKDINTDKLSNEQDVRKATATHQYNFPFDREEEGQVTRREFCNFLALTSSALFVASAGFAGKAAIDARTLPIYPAKKIEGAENLLPNSSLNFRYPTEKDTAILIRSENGSYYAYGQKCTHLTCPVYYDTGHKRIECPCHEGAFDVITGKVLHGPPPRPLDFIELEVRENGEVWAINRRVGSNDERG